jgi:hypothetical protein
MYVYKFYKSGWIKFNTKFVVISYLIGKVQCNILPPGPCNSYNKVTLLYFKWPCGLVHYFSVAFIAKHFKLLHLNQ